MSTRRKWVGMTLLVAALLLAGAVPGYYCEEAKAYYPYVQQCPGGWRQVTPTPP